MVTLNKKKKKTLILDMVHSNTLQETQTDFEETEMFFIKISIRGRASLHREHGPRSNGLIFISLGSCMMAGHRSQPFKEIKQKHKQTGTRHFLL